MNSELVRLLLVETRQYNDVVSRTFNIRADNGDMQQIEAITNSGATRGNKLTESFIAGQVPNIIGLSAVGDIAKIPYGWQQSRLRFLMEVRTPTVTGERLTYLQGYSDYFDRSYTGQLDPRIMLHFNSITEFTVLQDPVNGHPVYRLVNSYNLFDTELERGSNFMDINPNKTIRPIDVVAGINMLNAYAQDGDLITYDTTGTTSNMATSRRGNSNATKYFTTTINSFIDAYAGRASLSYENGDEISNAASQVAEPTLMSNPFLKEINLLTGQFKPTSISIAVLDKMFPGVLSNPHTTQLVLRDQDPINLSRDYSVLDSDTTNVLTGSDFETIKAQELASAMMDMAVSNFITDLVISFTNRTMGEPIVVIQEMQTFTPSINDVKFCESLEYFVRSVIIPKLSYGGTMEVDVNLRLSLTGDTTIFIGYNGQPQTLFRFPTFADSLFTPVVCDKMVKDAVVEDFSNVLSYTTAAPLLLPLKREDNSFNFM